MQAVEPIRDKRDIQKMKRILKRKSLRDYAFFTLGINSALRISDLLALTVGDVADENGKIRDRIVIRERKTGKRKAFPISASAKKALQEYLRSRGECNPSEPLFKSRKGGKAITRHAAHQIISKAAQEAGIKYPVSTHSMRKSFGYWAYKSGHDLAVIQKLLNHSSQKVTLRYIGIEQDDLDDVYISMNL